MKSGIQERALAAGLRPDVLLEGALDGSWLAVEIFVTNSKNEESRAKYAELRQDAIEIELSGAPWDVDPEALQDLLLKGARRSWLYSGASELALAQCRSELGSLVDAREVKLEQELDSLVDSWRSDSNQDYLKRWIWPELVGEASDTDAFGKNVWCRETEQPKVTRVQRRWGKEGRFWTTTGLANHKTTVQLMVGYAGTHRLRNADRSTLVVTCEPTGSVLGGDVELSWTGIDRWQTKLDRLARAQLDQQLKTIEGRKGSATEFADRFRSSPDQERAKLICRKLRIEPPAVPGRVCKVWGTPNAVWKSLLWYYKVVRRAGKVVHVQQICTDRWICDKLLQLSNDPQSTSGRAKRVYGWFRELERAGYVRGLGRHYFEIADKLPRDFEPWRGISI